LYYNSGDRYEGEWENGLQNGKGILYYANGDILSAEWKNGKPSGKGKVGV